MDVTVLWTAAKVKMDPFISCPYNVTHRVPQSRIQAHIVKCKDKNPELIPCPYNATHRVLKSKLKHHVVDCPTRKEMFPENNPPKVLAKVTTPRPLLQRDYLPITDPNHEIWDDDF